MSPPKGPPVALRASTFVEAARAAAARSPSPDPTPEVQLPPPTKPSIHYFSASLAATDPSYKGQVIDFIPPTHLTDRTKQRNSVYIPTRGCKLEEGVLISLVLDYFDNNIDGVSYSRSKQRLEVNLPTNVDPGQYIHKPFQAGNMTLQVEKAYRADADLAIVKMTGLPLIPAIELQSLIRDFFDRPMTVAEIMIDVVGPRHASIGKAVVVLDISDDPSSLDTLPRLALVGGVDVQFTWRDCPLLCVYCKDKGHHRDACPELHAKSHSRPNGKKRHLNDHSPQPWTQVKAKSKQKSKAMVTPPQPTNPTPVRTYSEAPTPISFTKENTVLSLPAGPSRPSQPILSSPPHIPHEGIPTQQANPTMPEGQEEMDFYPYDNPAPPGTGVSSQPWLADSQAHQTPHDLPPPPSINFSFPQEHVASDGEARDTLS